MSPATRLALDLLAAAVLFGGVVLVARLAAWWLGRSKNNATRRALQRGRAWEER